MLVFCFWWVIPCFWACSFVLRELLVYIIIMSLDPSKLDLTWRQPKKIQTKKDQKGSLYRKETRQFQVFRSWNITTLGLDGQFFGRWRWRRSDLGEWGRIGEEGFGEAESFFEWYWNLIMADYRIYLFRDVDEDILLDGRCFGRFVVPLMMMYLTFTNVSPFKRWWTGCFFEERVSTQQPEFHIQFTTAERILDLYRD